MTFLESSNFLSFMLSLVSYSSSSRIPLLFLMPLASFPPSLTKKAPSSFRRKFLRDVQTHLSYQNIGLFLVSLPDSLFRNS
jgi:hypothetical protein